MRERITEIFDSRLDEVLTEADTLFGRWDNMPREERCPKALAAMEQMAELASYADEVSTYLQEAYPPIRLTDDEDWRERLGFVSDMIGKVVGKQQNAEEGKMQDLLEVVIPDENNRNSIADTMAQVTSMEDLLLNTLLSAFSHLHDLLLTLRATLDGDRTEVLALLYTKAEARYMNEEWRKGEKGGEWNKFDLHMHNTKFPWNAPTCEQLQSYYQELTYDFDKTPLGKVFLENEDDPQALGSAIAKVGCSNSDLKSYFREVFRLRELKKMIDGMRSETDIQHLDFEKTIPEEFRTGLLLKAWNKLVENQILTKDYQLAKGTSKLAAKYIVESFCHKKGMNMISWKPFEDFWGLRNLKAIKGTFNKELESKISKIFREL